MANHHNNPHQNQNQQQLDGAFLLSLLRNPPQPPADPTNPPPLFHSPPAPPPSSFPNPNPHPHWAPDAFRFLDFQPTLPRAPDGLRFLDFQPTLPPPPDLGISPPQRQLGGPYHALDERRGSSSMPPPGFGRSAGVRGAEFPQGVSFRSAAVGEHRQLYSHSKQVQGESRLGIHGFADGGDKVNQGWNQLRGTFGTAREVQSSEEGSQLRSVNFSEKSEGSVLSRERNKGSVGLEDEDFDSEWDNEGVDDEIIRRMRVLDVVDERYGDDVSFRKDSLVELNGFGKQMDEVLEATAENVSIHMGRSRGKDFRSDFSRGHHVSSQRIRIQRRTVHCRHDIDAFAPNFLSIFGSLVPAEEEKAKHKHLLTTLGKLINKEWPSAKLYLYGSCANSFGVSNSDIDLCLSMSDTEISKPDILLKLADILQSGNLENVQALTRARVPIVKLKDPVTGLSCDICINNLLAVVNTKLLRDYALIDVRLRQLAFIVKHWAKSRCVNETYQGTLSSYAYVLMCIHFLQLRRPAILPCLQALEPTYAITVDNTVCSYFDQVEKLQSFGSRNKESISRLVWAFFQYWAYHHDYTNDVISVRTGSLISKQAKDWTRRIGNDRHLICIEDPFEISHDLGRVVDKFSIKILREEFERAANILQFDPNPSVTLFEPYVRDTTQNYP